MELSEVKSVVFVKCKETSLKFFRDMLGFKVTEMLNVGGKQCPVLESVYGELMTLCEQDLVKPETIVLRTSDCLRDYYLFKKKSLLNLTRPRYVDRGLQLCFSDPSGNQFVIIEERDYTEL